MKKCAWITLLCLSFSARADMLDSMLRVAQNEKDPVLNCGYYLAYINRLASRDRDSASLLLSRYEELCGTHFDYGRYRSQSLRAYYLCFSSRYEESLRLLFDALSKQKAIKDESGAAQTLNRLGLASSNFGRFEQAIHYENLARAEFIRLKDSAHLEAVLNNLGVLYSEANQKNKAIQYYLQSLAIRLSKKDFFWVAYSYYNIGEDYLQMQRMDSARYYLDLAIHTFETKTETGRVPSMVYLGAGMFYLENKDLSRAYNMTLKGLDDAYKIEQTELILEGKLQLSKVLFAQHQYKKAYEIQQEYLDLKFSVDSGNNARAVAEMETKYKTSEQALQIEQLSTQKLDAENKAQRLSLYAIIIITLIIALAGLFGWMWQRRNQREKIDRSILNTRIAEAKMFALRAQMNPHFIFNCINTAQHFVMKNQQQEAYEYLSDFAKLLRLVMENSARTFIPLEDELQQLKLYLELETIRFNHKFNYTIKIDNKLGNGVYEIPGMIIQPIVENAIGHGLINRNDDKGLLLLQLSLKGDLIECEITDNGVGRKRAAEIKAAKTTHYQSAAIPNIKEQLDVLRIETGIAISMSITDLENEGNASGTRVVMYIPYR